MFFRVPNHGMDITSLISMARNGPNRFLVKSINIHNSQILNNLHREFQKALGKESESEIFCFYKTEMSLTAKQVRPLPPVAIAIPILIEDRIMMEDEIWMGKRYYLSTGILPLTAVPGRLAQSIHALLLVLIPTWSNLGNMIKNTERCVRE